MRLDPAMSALKTGVYIIRNRVNGRVYVGSAARSIDGRWAMHRSELRRGVHGNRLLQNSWNKHGEPAFEFSIICACSPEWCVTLEQIHINRLHSANPKLGYNLAPLAGSCLGVKHSAEVVALNRSRQIGKKMSDEFRGKMKSSMARRMANPVEREKILSAMASGRTSEVIARGTKKKKAYWKNPKPEHVSKLNKWRASDRLRDMAAAQFRGVKKTAEHRAKIGAAHVGMKRSEDSKRRMSDAAKRRCATRAGISQMKKAAAASCANRSH